jgi:uncharacterized membrane protein (UPF0127 family)
MKFRKWLMPEKLNLRFAATDDDSRSKGLMHQCPLSKECALFEFPHLVKTTFWNKNVSFPIDLGFFDQKKRLVDFNHLNSNQEEHVGCKRPFQYVLEVPRGYFEPSHLGRELSDFIST